jgi:hypothetical protein
MSLRFQHRDKRQSWYSQPTQNHLNGTSEEVIFKPVIPGLKRQVSDPISKLRPVAPTELDAARNNSIKVQCLTAFDVEAFPFSPTRRLKSGSSMRRPNVEARPSISAGLTISRWRRLTGYK